MALGFDRNRDTLDVFNDRWKANHSYNNIKDARQNQSDFNSKMFGSRPKTPSNYGNLKPYTSRDKLNDMNNKIESNKSINTDSHVRNILDGFRK